MVWILECVELIQGLGWLCCVALDDACLPGLEVGWIRRWEIN
jgi:hypothetical protein